MLNFIKNTDNIEIFHIMNIGDEFDENVVEFLKYRNKKKTKFCFYSHNRINTPIYKIMNTLQNYKNLTIGFAYWYYRDSDVIDNSFENKDNNMRHPDRLHHNLNRLNKKNYEHVDIPFNEFNNHFNFSFNYFFNI